MTTYTITKLKYLLLANEDELGRPIPAWKVGRDCSIPANAMSCYTLGQRPMTQDHLHALCAYFDCEPFDLAGTIDVEVPDQQDEVG